MSKISIRILVSTAIALPMMLLSINAQSATCGNDGSGFERWKKEFKQEARASGFSGAALKSLDGVTYNKTVVRLDRNQKRGKRQSFEKFASKRITKSRISKGKSMLRKHAKLLRSIEAKYGVPGNVVVAIWGLETDFGANQGKMSAVRSLATLAYDCRRSEFFTNELNAALSIIKRGDMSPSQMKGAWAGELGQTQFLASSYLRYAVDFDRNGRRDLVRSVADALASTANYLKGYGWKRGGGFGLNSSNFRVYAGWNRSTNYQKTIALFATKLAG